MTHSCGTHSTEHHNGLRTLCLITPRNRWYILESERIAQLHLPASCLKLPKTVQLVNDRTPELYDPSQERIHYYQFPWVDCAVETKSTDNRLAPFVSNEPGREKTKKTHWGVGAIEAVDVRRWCKFPGPKVSELRAAKKQDEERLRKVSVLKMRSTKTR
ncbi:unnamed protein product [Echinostoma caproni]|uniref:POPLD domain-containing protein n=1 Tax=Echinostoma caproni TaxID=27848 RepID=A0A183AT71_9TREM|nr:unnamed protein product [Echinostoma caproni]